MIHSWALTLKQTGGFMVYVVRGSLNEVKGMIDLFDETDEREFERALDWFSIEPWDLELELD